ncbi:MAG: AbrB family transcriptional regulator [Deltaproteobacteria bacterium RIFOXYD12_FULL_57_12]|nr:MAG: AbrB family transcriptional regulator [Deltaproteobacteria bacterium RIFOXYD12_FULL_57_12]
MQVTSKGQVTIPLAIRNKLGIMPHTEVDFIMKDDIVQLVKVEPRDKSRGSKLIKQMRGKATVRMTTDEIMSMTRGDE